MSFIPSITPNWEDIEIRRENGRIQSVTMFYNIRASEGEQADSLLQTTPNAMLGVPRTSTSVSRLGSTIFEGTVEYEYNEAVIDENDDNPSGSDFTLSFDTSGGTQHIKQSYSTLAKHAAPGYVPNTYNGAIGVQDGQIAGCDVIVPSLSFTMSKSAKGIITIDAIRKLTEYTGRINSLPFLGFGIGDVLLEGVNGSQNFTEDGTFMDLSYKFRVVPSIYNLQAGEINVGYKAGWDYFWVEYQDYFDYDCISKSMEPRAAYIEEVYQSVDFAPLLNPMILL